MDALETINGYQLTTEWKNSQCGKTAKAKKGGKLYFLKKYQTPVEPVMNGALDERTFNKNKVMFEKFVSVRRRVNTALRSIAGAGGNIIIPREEFVADHHYVEAAEFIDGAVSDDDLEGVLHSMAPEMKHMIMLTAAGSLGTIHRLGIIHSDLKLKNVLLVRNGSGNHVAKIIDFDSSYYADDIPEEVTGDVVYYSPELGRYSNADEEDRPEMARYLTNKSDIFSLGLIFHRYLCEELPEAKALNDRLKKRVEKGKPVYCWMVLNGGCELKINDKIRSLKYRCLIRDMLSLDPSKRPDSTEVLRRLKEPEITPGVEDPWPEHGMRFDSAKVRAAGIYCLKRITSGGEKKYQLITAEGDREEKTKEDLIASAIAIKNRDEIFVEPWPEHNVVYDEEKLRSRGFVAAERKEMSGAKGYEIFRRDDSSLFMTVDKMRMMGYVKPRPIHIEEIFAEPWPEHPIEFDTDAIKRRGFVRSEQKEMNGKKGYLFFKADGTQQFILSELVVLFKMAKKI